VLTKEKITEIKNQAKLREKHAECQATSLNMGEPVACFDRGKKNQKHKLTNSTQKGSSWEGEENLPKPISRHISIGWAKDQAGVCSGLQPTDDDNDHDDSQVTEIYS
jgi:hypothetical protein